MHINDDCGIKKCYAIMRVSVRKYWVSEIFEDVADLLLSRKYIACLRKLDKQYPELDLTLYIDFAESHI
ncbi:hypothetical protein [Virgibacillus sp. 7505]|uniref:hypothetical protein n=1 Tax=Virgibacillus sp. 7505 TaxID=2022548 RepID=UPI0025701D30|nr:hypothetical protein [Virgibacillus sp. 7505]